MVDYIFSVATFVGSHVSNLTAALTAGSNGLGGDLMVVAIYGGLAGGLVYGQRFAVRQFRKCFAVHVLYEITNPSQEESEAFDEVLEKLYELSPTKRHFELIRAFHRTRGGIAETRKFGAKRGTFLLFSGLYPIWVSYGVHHKEQGEVRSLDFNAYFVPKEKITEIIGEPKAVTIDKNRYRYLMANTEDMQGCFLMARQSRRTIKELNYYLPDRIKKIVDKACDVYSEDHTDRSERGVMNKFNVLAYGPPGIGKSVIADYISQRLKKNILVPFFGRPGSSCFLSARTASRLNAIVFLDEVDANLITEHWAEKSGSYNRIVSKESRLFLQSVLEGSLTIEDQIFVMTTNHPEILGEAMLRNSRIDLLLFMDYWIHEDIDGWFNYYYPGSEPVGYSFPKTYRFRTCDMAHLYKRYPDDFASFVNEMRTLDVSLQEGYDKWNKLETTTPDMGIAS